MPIVLKGLPTPKEPAEVEIKHPSGEGSARVTLQQFDRRRAPGIAYMGLSVYRQNEQAEDLEGKAKAFEYLQDFYRAVCRVGVAGHRAEDFLTPEGEPTPYETQSKPFANEIIRETSEATLDVYDRAGMLGAIAHAALDYQPKDPDEAPAAKPKAPRGKRGGK